MLFDFGLDSSVLLLGKRSGLDQKRLVFGTKHHHNSVNFTLEGGRLSEQSLGEEKVWNSDFLGDYIP